MAVVVCATGLIGSSGKTGAKKTINSFPFQITDNIFYCGFNSEKSFGVWSYLIVRPSDEGGNILVDSPRFSVPLVERLEVMSGTSTVFLSHRDDIADYALFAEKFGAERILYADNGANCSIERLIEGESAVKIDDESKLRLTVLS